MSARPRAHRLGSGQPALRTLQRIAGEVGIQPPAQAAPRIAENEWSKAEPSCSSGSLCRHPGYNHAANPQDTRRARTRQNQRMQSISSLSARQSFNIQHVETLVVHHIHLDPDDGRQADSFDGISPAISLARAR